MIQSYFFVCFCFFIFALQGASLSELVNEANLSYRKGEQAVLFEEQEQAFNQALKLYFELVEQIDYPSGSLYQALAATYFQLGAPAWSILYNEKALKLDPRNSTILDHIQMAREQLGLESIQKNFNWRHLLLLDSLFSEGEKKVFFLVVWFLTIFMTYLAIWHSKKLFNNLSIVLNLFSLLLLFNIMLNYYFSPLEAILIESTGYYREPDKQQPQLTLLPKKAGTKVRVLTTNFQGNWLKVVDSEGLIGYIPARVIRII